MLELFIVYTLLIALVYAVELGVKFYATRKKVAVVKANTLRVTVPIKVILSLFAITVMELVIFNVFEVITEGFVRANNIFFGIVAAIFTVDYILEQYKLRGYDRVLLNAPLDAFDDKSDTKLVVKTRGGYYARKFSIDYLNKYDGAIKTDIRALIIKAISLVLLFALILTIGIILIVLGADFVDKI